MLRQTSKKQVHVVVKFVWYGRVIRVFLLPIAVYQTENYFFVDVDTKILV